MKKKESLASFMAAIRKMEIKLWVEAGKLKYQAPSGVMTKALLQEITERKSEIIDFLRPAENSFSSFLQPIPRVAQNATLPLSYAQQRLWFLDQLEGLSPTYNIIKAFQVEGAIAIPVFERCLNELIKRHEILRTSFKSVDGKISQAIAPVLQLQIPQVDLRNLSSEEQQAEVKRLIGEISTAPYDLSQSPLLRVKFLWLQENSRILLIGMHHIISDGWSLSVLIKELTILYTAFSVEQLSPLPKLPIQYADFSVWQRQQLSGKVLVNHLKYWQETLAGARELLQLPTDYIRPLTQTFKGSTKKFSLSITLTQKLQTLSQESNVTLFMTLLAAFTVLLYRYSHQEDIVIGSPIANRNRKEIEPLIGFFVNMLVLRIDVSGDPAFSELIQQVKKVTLAAYDHQELPFEKLVQELHPERNLSYGPLYQVSFVLQNTPREVFQLQDITISSLNVKPDISRDDLTMFCWESAEGLQGSVEYSTDLFTEATIEGMIKVFQTLLAGIVTNPELTISQISLLDESEKQQLISKWQPVTKPFFTEKCIHHLFEAQVAANPQKIAVISQGSEITYEELNRKANQLAHYLQKQGLVPEAVVGIYLQRDIEMIVAFLGVLKAGGAYVPLDPQYPQERLVYMLEDAAIYCLVTKENIIPDLPTPSIRRICLDTQAMEIFKEPKSDICSGINSANLACIIYTSGSTGTPKGVMITHQSLVVFTETVSKDYQLNEQDRILQFSSISFDGALEEIYSSLSCGATIVLRTDDMLSSVPYFFQKCWEWKITVLDLPTAYWHQLAAESGKPDCKLPTSLRLIILAGERLQPSQVALWQKNVGYYPEVINVYGPTEAIVAATLYKLSASNSMDVELKEVPIGRPLSNYQVYILDQNLQPTPVGVPGELHIGGAALAQGYLNQPQLTQKKFIVNKFSSDSKARLYKTGDLARYTSDGNITFLGRLDHQVKIRGFRVEPGEIESILAKHSLVKEVVVVPRESNSGTKSLVAYVVAENSSLTFANEGSNTALHLQQVLQWKELFKDSYSQQFRSDDLTFNIVGWNSSYTRSLIPKAEMQEWVEQTVVRISSLKPQKVWEIGCGTGLLLFRLALDCQHYLGTDFSPEALAFVQQQLQTEAWPMVELKEQEADNFAGIAPGEYDTVIINSVIQYFPNIDYLLRVLQGIVKLLPQQANIFIGDVRSLPLLEAFYTSVELYQAEVALSPDQLQNKVQKRIAQEEELLIDPAFFYALNRYIPSISGVQVSLKRGNYLNEMTKFRYDVILQIGQEDTPFKKDLSLDWQKDRLTLPEIRRILTQAKQERLIKITNVKNARLFSDIKGVELLADYGKYDTVHQLQQALASIPVTAVDPEDFWKLGEEYAWNVNIGWSFSGNLGCFDVFLSREVNATFSTSGYRDFFRPWNQYGNNPLQSKFANQLLPEIRAFVANKLPEFMQPSAYIILDSLPLTANGKINRKALPIPDYSRPVIGDFVAPRTAIEQSLVNIWQELLEIERVGIEDNFFELGGHSLLATQVISRVRELFQVDLTVRVLFEKLTITGLAWCIETTLLTNQTLTGSPLQPVSREQALRVSFAQERFWFMHQLAGNNAAYNISCALHLKGKLNIKAMEASISEIVRRHEILRTTFPTVAGQPIQIIAPFTGMALDITVLPTLSESSRTQEIQRLIQQASGHCFDLTSQPLMRSQLIRLGDEENLFILIMHHIISDGWSVGIFMKELSVLYEAFNSGKPSPLPELLIQSADFAAWQRTTFFGEILEKQLSYWKKQLAGALPLLELPTDYQRPPVQQFRGASHSFSLPQDVHQKLLSLGQREGCTLYMTLLAAFQTLLYRYTGQEDIIVSTGIANRNHPKLEDLIGCFINILILRTDLSGNPKFIELMQRVREVTLQAYAHQDLPFEQLTVAINQERDLSYHPVAQVMFILQNSPLQILKLPEITATSLKIQGATSQLDLNLQMWETPNALEGYISYNTDLFEATTIARMLDCFTTLLQAIVINPDENISTLPLLNATERQKILLDWNATETAFPEDQCLHQLFELNVEKHPNAIAICYEQEQITYGELNRRANQLAHYFQKKGIGTDAIAAICMEKSVEMVVGILGILKAGAAYLPLDPSYPKARLAFMLEDINAQIVLIQHHLISALPGQSAVLGSPQEEQLCKTAQKRQVICIDADWQDIAASSIENPHLGVSPSHLAYVIYTSGSTGKPKGIAINHLGVVNNITDLNRSYRVGSDDRVLVLSSLSFDMCVYETLGLLAAGGTLIVPSQAIAKDPAQWARLIQQHQVTVWNSAPALLKMLVDYVSSRPEIWPKSIRVAFLGGDWIPTTLPQRLQKLTDGTEVVCMGGATEASIHSILYQVDTTDPNWKSIPYGKPMANQKAFILDAQLQPVPIGVPGELHLGGIGLARGYCDRPELTRMKFIPAPFSEVQGERIYKTGDLARYLPDGNIQLLGRIDYQIKLRGHRIELGEIEAELRKHTAVKECVALVIGNSMDSTTQRLVTYIIPAQHPHPSPEELRHFLKQKLPEYMLPSAYIIIDKFPLSPNGKIDRLKLLELTPESLELTSPGTFVLPRSPLEQVIALIWAEVLRVNRMGVNDNFFAIGGHSLIATQVINRLQEIFPIDIALRLIFQSPTVAQMAETMEIQGKQMQINLTEISEIFLQVQALSQEEITKMLAEDTR
ncbi:non-ribosomal peptide synthetase [Nostoc sp. PA-18-2419]|uniref:non-ribosomal peptide synthetase n=1 Tax=Nostoc sp. PA-18-2419 TaxID=2575443 RepID=UPI0011090D22|nr:non-ribosomal peptide synthetase [Nostoc sp. PA-18-2419]